MTTVTKIEKNLFDLKNIKTWNGMDGQGLEATKSYILNKETFLSQSNFKKDWKRIRQN